MSRSNRALRIRRALFAFAGVAIFYGYAFRLARVQGRSMEPTFRKNQWLLVRRLNWPAPPLRKGEVVVFMQDGEMLVKRIAALPGEPFPYPSAANPPTEGGQDAQRVPPGQLFVVGDNLPESDDSREFGPISMETVLGRVIHWKRGPKKAPAVAAQAVER